MKLFFQICRAPFFGAVLLSAGWGLTLAYRSNYALSWLRIVLLLTGLIAAHAAANLLNDYFDYRSGADRHNPYRNRFSGGSPHIAEGIVAPRTFLLSGLACACVAAGSALILGILIDGGPGPVWILALAGGLAAFAYTAPPLQLAYRGLGELTIFTVFGPLTVAGAYYVQTAHLTPRIFAASLPLALMITAVIMINEFPDYTADRAAGKATLIVRLGPRRARWVFHALTAAAALSLILPIYRPVTGIALRAAPAILPLAAAAVILHHRALQPRSLTGAQGLTILAHTFCGIGLISYAFV